MVQIERLTRTIVVEVLVALRNIWYWFSHGGPVPGGIVMSNGTVMLFKFDAAGRNVVSANLPRAVAWVRNGGAGWYAEGTHPLHLDRNVYLRDLPDAEAAGRAVVIEMARLKAEEEGILADPAAHLDRELGQFDWFAHFSDAPGVCSASDRHWDRIQGIRAQVAPEVYEALLAKHQPKS